MNQLQRTYSDRADRADRAPDVDEVMDLVHTRAGQRRHRRRTALAAGTTSLAVAALVVTGSVVWSGSDDPTSAHSTAQRAGVAKPADATDGLVAVAPAPAAAEASLGLLPPGWSYEGYADTSTTYIAPGATPGDPNHFVGKIAVLVGQRYEDASAYTLTAAGRPARISVPDADNDGYAVGILVPDRDGVPLEVLIQIPVATGLTRDQMLAMANSLDVRSTVHYAVG